MLVAEFYWGFTAFFLKVLGISGVGFGGGAGLKWESESFTNVCHREQLSQGSRNFVSRVRLEGLGCKGWFRV